MLDKYASNKDLDCAWEQAYCDRKAAKRGYCNKHYMRYYSQAPRQNGKTCKIEGCENSHRGRGLCINHYTQEYEKNKEVFLSEDPDNFDYEDFWLFVKKELQL
jgi:hypothetical protein